MSKRTARAHQPIAKEEKQSFTFLFHARTLRVIDQIGKRWLKNYSPKTPEARRNAALAIFQLALLHAKHLDAAVTLDARYMKAEGITDLYAWLYHRLEGA